jgi:hypothetical protein
MAADLATQERIKRTGLGVLPPATGLQALAALIASGTRPHPRAQTLASVPVNWATLLNVGRSVPFFFTDVVETPGGGAVKPVGRTTHVERRRGSARRTRRSERTGRPRTALVVADGGSARQPAGLRGSGERTAGEMVELVGALDWSLLRFFF